MRKAWKKPALPVTIAASGFDGFYGEETTVSPPGCFSETPSIKCNCANDRGCRRLDIVRSQFNAANATRHPELGGHGATRITATATALFTPFRPPFSPSLHWLTCWCVCAVIAQSSQWRRVGSGVMQSTPRIMGRAITSGITQKRTGLLGRRWHRGCCPSCRSRMTTTELAVAGGWHLTKTNSCVRITSITAVGTARALMFYSFFFIPFPSKQASQKETVQSGRSATRIRREDR